MEDGRWKEPRGPLGVCFREELSRGTFAGERSLMTRFLSTHSTACRKPTPTSPAFPSRPCLLKSASTSFHRERPLPSCCLQFCLPFSTWLKSCASSVV